MMKYIYTDGSQMNERERTTAAIFRHFQKDETACRETRKMKSL